MITDWIEIGEVSAERDTNLINYFYDAGVSAKIVNNPKQYLLLGRKGAGKTAVYMHLIQTPQSVFKDGDAVVGLSLQSYNWQAHNLLSNDLRSGGFQHRDSWRFVISVESIKAIVSCLKKEGKDLPKPIAKATAVLEKLFSSPIPSWTDLLGTKLFSLATAKLPELGSGEDGIIFGGGELSFEKIKESTTLKNQLNQNIENLTDWFEKCLESAPSHMRVFLAFDRLDEAWVTDFISESKSILSGLLHASEHVLQKFGGRIRPLIFLREDIFSTFEINDRNKLREDCSESLRWSQDDIEKLALERINYYAKRAGKPLLSSLQEIFLEKEMRSRTTPIRHLYNRTMGRPRDMVAFLGRTFVTARAEKLCSSDGNKILTRAIYAAEPGYSEYLFEELSDEWRNQNPSFLEYLRTLENLRYAAITTEELELALTTKGFIKERADFRNIVRFLFENSIIGITVGDSKQWRYKCFYQNQAFLDTDVIKTHPGLIKRLGLTEGASDRAGKSGVESISEE
ncbi:MAG: hypothetical protein WAT12_14965 [Candidatus Nitrotoga sp.]